MALRCAALAALLPLSFAARSAAAPDCDPATVIKETDVTVRLGDAVGMRGEAVQVPFSMVSNGRMQGFAYSIDFDEEALQVERVQPAYRRPNGEPWPFEKLGINNENRIPGNAGFDEGYVWGGVVFDFDSRDFDIPAGVETKVLDLTFSISPQYTADSTEVRFLDGAPGVGVPVENQVVICGLNIFPRHARSFVLIGSRIHVVDEIPLFIRGDSNRNGTLDVSDAIATLDTLFHGTRALSCHDAADSNDDGRLDLSDPITTVSHLFLGQGPLPSPEGAPGVDPTPDTLICLPPGR